VVTPRTIHAVHVASGRLFGGIEQMLLTIARHEAVLSGITSTFAVAAQGRLAQGLRDGGVSVHDLGDVRLSRPLTVLLARRRFRQLLRATRADVAVFHAPWSYAIFAPVAARARVPAVLWQHDRADGASVVDRWAARTPAALVVANSAWTSRTTAAIQPDVPVKVIHPPVVISSTDGTSRTELRNEFGFRSDDVVILCASRMEPWKGHRTLIRALGRLHTSRPWRAVIAGGAQRHHECEYVDELQRAILALGLEARVQLLGERADVSSLMRAADVFCQPNERPEPFGVVFAEALLSNLPVVTIDMGGAPEIVSRECGRLVAAADDDALIRALTELVEDDAVRSRLAAAGPSHAAARCAPNVVFPQIESALHEAAARKPRPRVTTRERRG
jgi:glycosyltransferase involved in cell wall biosynthesis